MEENNKNSRRKFLKLGIGLGIGSVVGSSIIANAMNEENKESGETVKMLSADGKLIEVDKAHIKTCCGDTHCEPAVGDEARNGIPYRKFVMVIDLARCKNARKCVEACKHAHHLTDEKEWIKVYKMQDGKNTAPYWFPKPCYHCDKASCVSVCPVNATFKRSDGIVLIDSDKCIGCKYCMIACPYSSRYFNWTDPVLPDDLKDKDFSPESSVPGKRGTVGKCDFCPDMLKNGELPHCVKACPMGVLYFGDVNEDTVTNGEKTLRFSELMKDKAGYRYMEYFGTEPNVYYLPPVDRAFPFSEETNEETENS